MAKPLPKSEPIHNPILRYTLVYPDGSKQGKQASVTGYLHDRQQWVDQQLHGLPIGTHVENLRQVDRRGRDLPTQPAILRADEPRTEKFGHVPAFAKSDGPRAAALPKEGTKIPADQPRRPRRLMASEDVHRLVEAEGLDTYPGVTPYTPPAPSNNLDYDGEPLAEDEALAPPVTPTSAAPSEADKAVRVVGEPRSDTPPAKTIG